jgi:hypothetical protein
MVAVGLPCGLRVGDQVSDTREGLPERSARGLAPSGRGAGMLLLGG